MKISNPSKATAPKRSIKHPAITSRCAMSAVPNGPAIKCIPAGTHNHEKEKSPRPSARPPRREGAREKPDRGRAFPECRVCRIDPLGSREGAHYQHQAPLGQWPSDEGL